MNSYSAPFNLENILDLKIRVFTSQGHQFEGILHTYEPDLNCVIIQTKSPSSEKRRDLRFIRASNINRVQLITSTPVPSEPKLDSTKNKKGNQKQTEKRKSNVSNGVEEADTQSIPVESAARVDIGTTDSTDLNRDATWARICEKPPSLIWNVVHRNEARAVRAWKESQNLPDISVSGMALAVYTILSKTLPCEWENDTILVFDTIRVQKPYRAENISGDDESILNRVRLILERELPKVYVA